ncbi:hypothetical protein QCD60_10450 [Pokkaliibacter sp. MBI-7]|uniref:hypothetical protein n=1 Tax=Pokkaliibacter sp. MBI-7 TaxID=3040600 RepID=UPI002447747E|nr:hypothetical protein [Pokkaliibacter sp. MBI-7]MDH2432987.1 hypothetical protein [Pokkaliibacter sp. MBI-7]
MELQYNKSRLFKRSLLTLAITTGSAASWATPLNWDNVRDGTFYLFPQGTASLQLNWQDAVGLAAQNEDHLFLLNRKGGLNKSWTLGADKISGSDSTSLTETGPYQLEIAAYSARRFNVKANNSTVIFQPPKGHYAMDTNQTDAELFFKVKANEQAKLGGKYYRGITALEAVRLSDNKKITLTLNQSYQYGYQYDLIDLPSSSSDQVWKLTLKGQGGRPAFWLDGTDNYFAQTATGLDTSVNLEIPGTTNLVLSSSLLGATPKLGMYGYYYDTPNKANNPPAAAITELLKTKPKVVSLYALYDSLIRDPARMDAPLAQYKTDGIEQTITLVSGSGYSGSTNIIADNSEVRAGIGKWLDAIIRANYPGTHYLAIADEPNFSYSNYQSYENAVVSLSSFINNYPGARQAGVRVIAPASSRFTETPPTELDAVTTERRGSKWAEQLLNNYPNALDALAWHEWMVYDLLDTRRYRTEVQTAASLVGKKTDGSPRIPLLIDQTNIGPGNSTSDYEQNTLFAAMWWASAVINASQDGLLSAFSFFPGVDDTNHHKGIMNSDFQLRPVGYAQQFVAKHWLAKVQKLTNDAFEVDAMAMSEGTQRRVLGVNKAPYRTQNVSLGGTGVPCNNSSLKLTVFNKWGEYERSTSCSNGKVTFTVPGETIFALSWTAQ